MEVLDSRAFSEQIFSVRWQRYLATYGILRPVDEWFYRTVSQAYDAFEPSEKLLLTASLVKVNIGKRAREKQALDKNCKFLFDEMLEPFFLQKLSVFIVREIFTTYLAIQKDRRSAFEENKKVEALISYLININTELIKPPVDASPLVKDTANQPEDTGIIDVTGEGQQLDFYNEEIEARDVSNNTTSNLYDDQNNRLGSRYKKQLALSNQEVKWLNKFWDPHNSFLAIEQCCIAVMRLYLLCLKEVALRFHNMQSDFFKQVKKFIIQNQSRKSQYLTTDQFIEQAEAHIFITFFRRAEGVVRDAYRHKRKINSNFNFCDLSASFERRFGNVWNEMVLANSINILPANHDAELKLNELNVNRWKFFFDEISCGITEANITQCALKFDELAEQNRTNTALENIYFEVSKLFVKDDKLTAVKFYLKYIHADLRSGKIDNKQLGKTIQKSLFSTPEQLAGFEGIINELVATRDLEAALLKAKGIYTKKRKKIQLDFASIDNVKSQHQATVNKLNELLQDEEEDFNNKPEIVTDQIELKIIQSEIISKTPDVTSIVVSIGLTEHQKGLLALFATKNYQLDDEALSVYAKNKNLFKNQLIESINDCCYEQLDDLLIEETGGGYEVNEYYYNKIINLC